MVNAPLTGLAMILILKILTVVIFGRQVVIYQYQKISCARGHRIGSVQFCDGVHLLKEVASGEGWWPSLFVQRELRTVTMQPDAIKAQEKLVAEGGCALFPWLACMWLSSPKCQETVAGRYEYTISRWGEGCFLGVALREPSCHDKLALALDRRHSLLA